MPAAAFQFFLDDAPDAAVVGERTLLAALRAYLEGLSSLAELSAVYLTKTGKSPRFPFMVMNALFDEYELNTGSTALSRETVQFTIQALDDLQADRLGRRAWKALTPMPRNPRMIFADGKEIDNGRQMRPYQKPREQPGEGPKGVPVWMVSFDVEFWIARDL